MAIATYITGGVHFSGDAPVVLAGIRSITSVGSVVDSQSKSFRAQAPATFGVWNSLPNQIFRSPYNLRVAYSPSHRTISGVPCLEQLYRLEAYSNSV